MFLKLHEHASSKGGGGGGASLVAKQAVEFPQCTG